MAQRGRGRAARARVKKIRGEMGAARWAVGLRAALPAPMISELSTPRASGRGWLAAVLVPRRPDWPPAAVPPSSDGF